MADIFPQIQVRTDPDGGSKAEGLPSQGHEPHTAESSKDAPGKLVRSNSSEIDHPNLSLRKLLLVGKTGTGKSSTGNTILGRKAFKSVTSSTSVTEVCRKESGEVAGREIIVVDTPGLFDTDLSKEELSLELSKCINMTAPGPHAIVLTIQLGSFSREDRQTVEKIRGFFGEEADRYTIILFTHGDKLTSIDIDKYFRNANKDLRQVMKQCGKYHVFDNTRINRRVQVVEFLDKVEEMVKCNGGECYTNRVYQNIVVKLKEKEEELRQCYQKDLEEQKAELESKFKEEKRKLEENIKTLKESGEEKERKIKELELLEEWKIRVLNENERYYKEKLTEIRQKAEQTQFPETGLEEMLNKLKI